MGFPFLPTWHLVAAQELTKFDPPTWNPTLKLRLRVPLYNKALGTTPWDLLIEESGFWLKIYG